MKPFDLEKAVAGAPVVYRNGERVSEVTHLATLRNQSQSVIAVPAMQGGHTITRHDTNGAYMPEQMDCAYDLFMAPVKREGWVNVYRDRDTGKINLGQEMYPNRHAAISAADDGLLTTLFMDWEE